MAASHKSDFGAALTGLIVGACTLFVLMFGIVKFTNALYSEHSKVESHK